MCLYDFTTKIFDHDHLVFSTRHLVPENAEAEEKQEEKKEQMPTGAWSAHSGKSLNLNFVDWKYCQSKCHEKANEVFSKKENNLNKSQQFEEIESGNVMNKSSRGGFAGRRTEFSSESNEAAEGKRSSRQNSTRTGLP